MMKTTTKMTMLALLAGTTAVHAAEISVPGDYFTLTAAITGAASGDTINLAAGFLPENVVVNKHLTIRGAGIGATVLEGQGLDAVITVAGNADLTLENVTIQGGGNNTYGGGIDALAAGAALYLTDVEIRDTNSSLGDVTYGGAIYISGGTLTGERVRFENNSAIRGGAVYLNSADAMLTDCEFVDNNAFGTGSDQGEGGAIWVTGAAATITDCLFRSNDGELSGGAVQATGSATVRISTSEFYRNTAARGGALRSETNAFYVDNSVFARNNAGVYGGAMYSTAKAYFLNCTLYENYGNNGPFECASGGDVDILNCIVVDAIGDVYGGNGTFTSKHSMHPEAPATPDANGNFSGDPMLVNVSEGVDDYRLMPGSPAIDAGDSLGTNSVMEVIFYPQDIDGLVRNLDDTDTPNTGVSAWELCIDMGAHEFQPTGSGPACVGDVTTAGAGVGDPGYGVPDGAATGADIQFFVNAWIAGCP